MAPSNALCIIRSEISLLSTALRCQSRIVSRGHHDEVRSPVYKSFIQLKAILNGISSINEIEPLVYLAPFLEVIRSEDTTGPITGLALTAVDKFLSYGLLELPNSSCGKIPASGPGSLKSVAFAVEAIADSGTQARFVGTERSSDEVVLMKVLHLLRTLLLVPAGSLVSDRVVREILQSCFRICFEPKLSELLRCTAEQCLASIIQLFFSRLPSLMAASYDKRSEKLDGQKNVKTNPRNSISADPSTDYKTEHASHQSVVIDLPSGPSVFSNSEHESNTCTANTRLTEASLIFPEISSNTDIHETLDNASTKSATGDIRSETLSEDKACYATPLQRSTLQSNSGPTSSDALDIVSNPTETIDVSAPQPQPYGLPAVHDLLHYLISLLTPERNADGIISVSLGLVTIALETGADAIFHCPTLLQLVQGDLAKHLLLLLYSDRVWQFAATLRVCFMLFESMRKHLKLQMEVYLQRLIAICSPDNESTSYERREVALESVVRLFLVPGLATELYVNYDCDPYCSNLFEDIAKMLAKNAYPVDRLMGTHLLALDALLAVLNTIETQCTAITPCATLDGPTSTGPPMNTTRLAPDPLRPARTRLNRHPTDLSRLPTREELATAKSTKKILTLGSEQFNSKPKRGIEFLQQHGILRTPLDCTELAHFLRENPRLDKRMIGEYLSDRNNGDVLAAYVRQFNFTNVPIDEALRVYLEAFRLPGEAPLIQRIMEHFADHWYYANNQPFADVDSAFTLAYAILMLNTDQHNPNSKKQNAPMTASDFKKNLSGMNGTGDFDPKLLESIYKSIHRNEIVMPSEQIGLVRENYLWKCLLRRATTPQADFIHVQSGTLDPDLFDIIWGPTVSALSFIFDKTLDPAVQGKAVDGFIRCAAIAAHHGLSDVLDNLVIALCKFTTLLSTGDNPSNLAVSVGRNNKALLSLRLVFALTASHADILRYGWHSLLDCLLQLFRASILPDELIESEDFLSPSHRVRLTTCSYAPVVEIKSNSNKGRGANSNKELSVFSSFYQYLTTGSAWNGTCDEDGDGAEESAGFSETKPSAAVYDRCDHDATLTNSGLQGRRLEQFSSSFWTSVGSVSAGGGQIDDTTATRLATDAVIQCEIPQLIKDTKFLLDASLIELIKALLRAIRGDAYDALPAPNNASIEWQNMEDPSINSSNPSISVHKSASSGSQSEVAHTISSNTLSNSTHSLVVDRSTTNEATDRDTPNPDLRLKRSMTMPMHTGGSSTAFLAPAPTTSYYPAFFASGGGGTLTEDCRIFSLELLIRILLHNRDRLSTIWPNVQYYLADMLLTALGPSPLIERVVVGFLRLATCLLRRHEMTSQIFACLHYIMLTRGDQLLLRDYSHPTTDITNHKFGHGPGRSKSLSEPVRSGVGLQIVAGLTDLLRNHAADLPDPTTDWQLVFGLLEVCGAGLRAPPATRHPHHASMQDVTSTHTVAADSTNHPDRGYTSDSEAAELTYNRPKQTTAPNASEALEVDSEDGHAFSSIRANSVNAWIVVDVGEPGNTNPSPGCAQSDVSVCFGHKAPLKRPGQPYHLIPSNVLALPVTIGLRDAVTLERAVDCLAFLVRDPAHITPDNFEHCVVALRIFVETCLHRHPKWIEGRGLGLYSPSARCTPSKSTPTSRSVGSCSSPRSTARSGPKHAAVGGTDAPDIDSDSDSEWQLDSHVRQMDRTQKASWSRELSLSPTTLLVAAQLLDLIHLLLTRATSIYTEWKYTGVARDPASASESRSDPDPEKESSTIDVDYLWSCCWRPLLQAIARLCCDCRLEVRTEALACLHRVLLSSVLLPLSGSQWEDCFEQVLFPLLSGFLESIAIEEAASVTGNVRSPKPNRSGLTSPIQYHSVEYIDPRMRAIPLLTKVFLQHLRPLHKSDNFHSLWSRILAYMEQYMQASSSDSLTDAVRESLKNVLLVMYTGTHDTPPILIRDATPGTPEAILWELTAKQLSSFLPELLDQLFPPPSSTACASEVVHTSPSTSTETSMTSTVSEGVSITGITPIEYGPRLLPPINEQTTVTADPIVTAQPAQAEPFTTTSVPESQPHSLTPNRSTEFKVVHDL